MTQPWMYAARMTLLPIVLSLLPPVATAAGATGEDLARTGNSNGATACAACHGMDGAGQADAGYPRLAGLPERYLIKQLEAFAEGTRDSAVMERIAGALEPEERQRLAQYYAALTYEPQQSLAPEAPGADLELGKRIAYLGKWERGVPACVRCHGEDGQGVPPFFPPIAAQHLSYLTQELERFQEGDRANDPLGLMRAVAQGLTDEELEAVAAYFASLPPGKVGAAGQERASRQDYERPEPSLLERTLGKLRSEPGFHSPPETKMPDDEFGQMVLLGKQIFVDTQHYAKQYVGNGLNCVNCHLDRGRHNASAPMGPAYVRYPKFRGKNKEVNTMEQRIQGCFRYSENGTPPPPLSKEMKALVSYFHWLASGAPVDKKMKEAGFAKVQDPPKPADARRGAQVFARDCALCHGAEGQGTRIDGRYQFPPLWGDDSYNWGAGMHRINTAAAFIHANMPLGKGGSLSVQEAWDVAAYVNSHQRPQDPRFEGDLKATKAEYHQHPCFYGDHMWGLTLGAGD